MNKESRKITEKNIKILERFVPIVDRVHGEHHPEFHKVKDIFESLKGRLREEGSNIDEIREDFMKLREITSDYSVPGDVCESYEAVYNMLKELDREFVGQ